MTRNICPGYQSIAGWSESNFSMKWKIQWIKMVSLNKIKGEIIGRESFTDDPNNGFQFESWSSAISNITCASLNTENDNSIFISFLYLIIVIVIIFSWKNSKLRLAQNWKKLFSRKCMSWLGVLRKKNISKNISKIVNADQRDFNSYDRYRLGKVLSVQII